jgi:hypothetical protein
MAFTFCPYLAPSIAPIKNDRQKKGGVLRPPFFSGFAFKRWA